MIICDGCLPVTVQPRTRGTLGPYACQVGSSARRQACGSPCHGQSLEMQPAFQPFHNNATTWPMHRLCVVHWFQHGSRCCQHRVSTEQPLLQLAFIKSAALPVGCSVLPPAAISTYPPHIYTIWVNAAAELRLPQTNHRGLRINCLCFWRA
jgi:hypothetical protein